MCISATAHRSLERFLYYIKLNIYLRLDPLNQDIIYIYIPPTICVWYKSLVPSNPRRDLMSAKDMLHIGDYIESPYFEYGYHQGTDTKEVFIDGRYREQLTKEQETSLTNVADYHRSTRVTATDPTSEGKNAALAVFNEQIVRRDASDKSRRITTYFVFAVNLSKDKEEGVHIWARERKRDGSPCCEGEVLHFVIGGSDPRRLELDDIKLVSRTENRFPK